jgi:hypothetical protein
MRFISLPLLVQANQAFATIKQRQVMGKVMILPESKSASPVSRL